MFGGVRNREGGCVGSSVVWAVYDVADAFHAKCSCSIKGGIGEGEYGSDGLRMYKRGDKDSEATIERACPADDLGAE